MNERRMKIDRYLCGAALIFNLGLQPMGQAAQIAPSAPTTSDHVLLITIDDLNDWIGCLTEKDAAADWHLPERGIRRPRR